MHVSVREGRLYEFGPSGLDPVRRSLTRDGAPIPLSPTLFDTLLHLVENPGRVVPRDELMDVVSPRELVEESNVSQTIFTLRKALAAAGASEPYIVTQSGRGYRFTQPVRTFTERPAVGAPPDADGETQGDPPQPNRAPPPAAAGRHSRRWSTLAVFAGAAVVLVAMSAGIWLWRAQAMPAPRVVVMGSSST